MSSIALDLTYFDLFLMAFAVVPGVVFALCCVVFALMNVPTRLRRYEPAPILAFSVVLAAMDLIVLAIGAASPLGDWYLDSGNVFGVALFRLALEAAVIAAIERAMKRWKTG